MSERLTLDSFIVRIYRADEDDMRHFTGIVESLDGSGERKPFADLDQLGKILNSHVGDKKKDAKNRF